MSTRRIDDDNVEFFFLECFNSVVSDHSWIWFCQRSVEWNSSLEENVKPALLFYLRTSKKHQLSENKLYLLGASFFYLCTVLLDLIVRASSESIGADDGAFPAFFLVMIRQFDARSCFSRTLKTDEHNYA